MDLLDTESESLQFLTNKIHVERFREEYDYMYDDNVSIALRRRDINPMCKEYIKDIAEKRSKLDVSQLTTNGMSESTDTRELCLNQAKNELNVLHTRIDEILYYKWDPLNLSNSTWARSHYENYVPEVLRLALVSSSYSNVLGYLTIVAVDYMSTQLDAERDEQVAILIYALAQNRDHSPDHIHLEVG